MNKEVDFNCVPKNTWFSEVPRQENSNDKPKSKLLNTSGRFVIMMTAEHIRSSERDIIKTIPNTMNENQPGQSQKSGTV
jgi:hypothetical protein